MDTINLHKNRQFDFSDKVRLSDLRFCISENMAAPSLPDLLEEKLRAQLEEEKRRYKTMFTHLKALKVEIEHLQLLMDKTKVKLQKEFEAWWAEEATNLQANSPAVNSFDHIKSSPQTPEFQHERPRLLSNKSSGGWEDRERGKTGRFAFCSDVNARKILPSPPYPAPFNQKSSTRASLEDSISERPTSSIPLTGDSQTDSDILAFIKARQNILQKKCKSPPLVAPPEPYVTLLCSPTLGGGKGEAGASEMDGTKKLPACSQSHRPDLPVPSPVPGFCLLLKIPEGQHQRCHDRAKRWLSQCSYPTWQSFLSLFQILLFSCLFSDLKGSVPLCPVLSGQEGAA
ncbi:kinesin-like protein KIF6 [Loxodonta africana]|uniref:kinesin-like protein KIF6 n=1 Tax=Loxodonta africana TaxID=9785 RepID=UPI0030CF97F5